MFRIAPALTRRVIGGLLLTVFVGGQGVGLWHEATERHAICAEHGEVIELGPTGEHTSSKPAPPHGSTTALTAAAEPGAGEHLHCELYLRRNEERTLVAPSPPLPACEHRSSAVVLAERPGGSSVAVLRVAPKGSPPA